MFTRLRQTSQTSPFSFVGKTATSGFISGISSKANASRIVENAEEISTSRDAKSRKVETKGFTEVMGAISGTAGTLGQTVTSVAGSVNGVIDNYEDAKTKEAFGDAIQKYAPYLVVGLIVAFIGKKLIK